MELVKISRENASTLIEREIGVVLISSIKKFLKKYPDQEYLTLYIDMETRNENLDLWEDQDET